MCTTAAQSCVIQHKGAQARIDELQHTATHCYTLLHTATHCYTLQHTATLCNSLIFCRTFHKCARSRSFMCDIIHRCTGSYRRTATHCSSMQHTATHCNTMQHTATHCSTLQHTAIHCKSLQHTVDCRLTPNPLRCMLQCVALCCSVLQCVVVCCSVLQCVAVCCSVLQCVAE